MEDLERQRLESEHQAVFYYSREERLKKMPDHRKLYNGEIIPKKGFFSSLVAGPGSKFMLGSIIFLVAIIIGLSLVTTKSNEGTIQGINVGINAFSFEDKIYVTVKLSESKDYSGDSEIEIEVGCYDRTKTLVDSKKNYVKYDCAQQLYRTTFTDYDIFKVIGHVKIGKETRSVSVVIDRP